MSVSKILQEDISPLTYNSLLYRPDCPSFIRKNFFFFVFQRGIGKKGKAAFRGAFGRVLELRSLMKNGTPVLGLTATANKDMRDRLIKYLGMKRNLKPIVVSPNKDNIRFTVLKADKSMHCFDWLVEVLKEKKENTPFTIIFCKTVNDIVSVESDIFSHETWTVRSVY